MKSIYIKKKQRLRAFTVHLIDFPNGTRHGKKIQTRVVLRFSNVRRIRLKFSTVYKWRRQTSEPFYRTQCNCFRIRTVITKNSKIFVTTIAPSRCGSSHDFSLLNLTFIKYYITRTLYHMYNIYIIYVRGKIVNIYIYFFVLSCVRRRRRRRR